ncbi:hypothetical protein RZN25_14540 [Bacillaceae bacterium S4-13-56]
MHSIETRSSPSVFQIAATYIGTVIGAGFASGQEVLQFFSAYGLKGMLGILLSTILFFWLGYTILLIGGSLQAKSYMEIIQFTNGKKLGSVINFFITIFLFGTIASMIAGAGAIFKEQFHLSPLWGTLFMALLTVLTVVSGTKGVVKSISFVVPFLMISVLFISSYTILKNPLSLEEIQMASSLKGVAPNWFIASLNYASYNLIIAITVLGPMGAEASNRKVIFRGALLGGFGLGIGVAAIYFSILTSIGTVAKIEIPMMMISSQISPFFHFLFAIALFVGIYTTAVSALYGFVSRMHFIPSDYRVWMIVQTTILAFLVSLIGFSNIVKYLYPFVGYCGLFFFGGLVYTWFTKRKML